MLQVGLTSEVARVLLPLAWLVRVEDTPEHRTWVRDTAAYLISRQQPCGAIHEYPFGFNVSNKVQQCRHHPPLSNEAYGTEESTMSQVSTLLRHRIHFPDP
jgi:hypothetical protein